MVYYYPEKKSLIFIKRDATPDYWDNYWSSSERAGAAESGRYDTSVCRLVSKYLKPWDGKIVEGGCGDGVEVAALKKSGYSAIGVDFAPKTVERLNRTRPELDIRLADVRFLPFPNNCFAGYTSLGVIEHFWGGYEAIAREMKRVLKPGGYLFISFPHMCGIRRLKVRLNKYKVWPGSRPENFYQFVLDHNSVIRRFGELGFSVKESRPFSGILGTLCEDTAAVPENRAAIQTSGGLYEGIKRNVYHFLSRRILPFAAHSVIIVMKKREFDEAA